jgi:hypothetical protein
MIESLQVNSILFDDLFLFLAQLFLPWMKFSQVFPLALGYCIKLFKSSTEVANCGCRVGTEELYRVLLVFM